MTYISDNLNYEACATDQNDVPHTPVKLCQQNILVFYNELTQNAYDKNGGTYLSKNQQSHRTTDFINSKIEVIPKLVIVGNFNINNKNTRQ